VTIAGLQLRYPAKTGHKQRTLLFITAVLVLALISPGIWGLFDWIKRWDARIELSVFTTPEPQAGKGLAQWLEPDRVSQNGVIWFAVIGDYGTGLAEEEDVAELVAAWTPDIVVTTGDNRYGAATFDQVIGAYYCDFLQGAGVGDHCPGGTAELNAFFPSPGNHDYSDGTGIEEYLNYFALPGEGVSSSHSSGSELYYDVLKGPVHFFVVDSLRALTSSTDNAAQQSWLQSQLAVSPAVWQIVVMHHPPYSSGSHGSQATMQWPYASWGADFVLAGHDHTYERIAADGIAYFVNGLGGRSIYSFGTPVPGSQVRYNGDYGAMLVEASQSQITFHFINRSGEVVDTALYQGSPPPSGDVKPRIYVPICKTIRQAN
jgi:hypothetical protein